MTVQLAPAPVFQGPPFGKLFSYQAGTTTPQATYPDSTQTTPNTNPVVLNALGQAFVWLDTAKTYKLILQDSLGNQIWSEDNISGGAFVSSTNGFGTDSGIANTYVFTHAIASAPASLVAGTQIRFIPLNTNTGPSTLNADGSGAVAIIRANGSALTGGELSSLGPVVLQSTGTQWQIVSTAGAQPGFERTAAEIAAGVTPTNYVYPFGDVRRYGALGDGVTDDTAAIQRGINAVGVGGQLTFPQDLTFICNGSLTGQTFQTWVGQTYEIGAGPSHASIKCTKTSGTFITVGTSQEFKNIRFLGVVTYTDSTGATSGSTCICMQLTDHLTLKDCVFQLQYICMQTQGTSSVYNRIMGGEVVRCNTFMNIAGGDVFNMELDRVIYRLCSTVIASNDTPTRYVHNLKVMGGSFESWVSLFNSIGSASFHGTYFESDILGGFGFNSDSSFTNSVSLSLFGCLIFINNLNRFVNFSGLTAGNFISIGNVIAGSVNSGQNQFYFVPQNSGGRTIMIGDYLDDRGTGTFRGSYTSDDTKVQNQLVVWPRGTTADHPKVGQTYVDGSVVLGGATPTGVGSLISIGNTTATTVGAAGGASAPPATPTGYLVIDKGGTKFKIAYYAN